MSTTSKASSGSRELGVGNASRPVWLVKVPNYLANLWKDAGADTELGRIIAKPSKKKEPDMKFILSEEMAKKGSSKYGGLEVPREHHIHAQDTSRQSLNCFSELASGEVGNVIAEGKVAQRTELQPQDSAAYRTLKQYQFKEAGKMKNSQVIQLDHVQGVKPMKDVTKQKPPDKRARDDREKVLSIIFNSFKTHEFYTFKDLVHITQQPPVYLKEILHEVCIYNTRAPHKNMWHLKTEYRHYKKAESEVT